MREGEQRSTDYLMARKMKRMAEFIIRIHDSSFHRNKNCATWEGVEKGVKFLLLQR